MANWSLLRPLGFSFLSKLFSPEMSAIDEYLTKTPNWKGGSNHSTTADVILDSATGAKLWVKAGFQADDAIEITFGSDGVLSLEGSVGHGARLNLEANSVMEAKGGSTIRINSSVLFYLGPQAILDVGLGGSSGNEGLIQVQQWGIVGFLSGARAIWLSGSFGNFETGSTLNVKAGAAEVNASVLGVQLTGTHPAANSDPGTGAIRKKQCQAYATMEIGGGVVTLLDELNVASAVLGGVGNDEVIITFAGAMSDAFYSVTWGVEDDATTFAKPQINGTKTTAGFHFNLWNLLTGGLVIDLAAASSRVVCFQVQGKR